MRKVFKIIISIVGAILLLVVAVVVYLNTPWGENFVREEAQDYLRKKFKTYVAIGKLGYGLPKYIELGDVLFKDQANDTLLSVKELKIDVNMLQLLHKKLDVQQVTLIGVHSHIYRNMPDTTYNFSYIITAFTGSKPKDTKKDTTSSSFAISVDGVKFDDIHFRIDDYTGGMKLLVNLDHLNLHMKKVDMDKMIFHVKELTVAGLQTEFSQDTSYLPLTSPDTTKTQLQLIADDASMQNISFQYTNSLNKILFGLQFEGLKMQLKKFDLANDIVDLKKLALNNSNIVVHLGKQAKAPAIVDSIINKDTTEGWHVTAGAMDLAGVNFKMDDDNSPRQPSGMDYAHMDFQKTSLSARNFLYTSDTIAGDIKHFSAMEQSGLYIKSLSTAFNYNPQGATLSNLYLKTPYTELRDHVEVHYPSLAILQKRMQTLELNVNLKNSTIGLSDVLLFVPELKGQQIFKKDKNGQLKIDIAMTGPLNNLNIGHLNLSGLNSTNIILAGKLGGLPDPKALSYNFNISRFQSSRKDVLMLVPDTVVSAIRIPDRFTISGLLSGTELDYNTNLLLVSTDGSATIKGTLSMSPGKGKEKYDMVLTTNKLNVGHIIKQDSLLGLITLDASARGTSFDVKNMIADIQAHITSAFIKGYRYHDITMSGNMNKEVGHLTMAAIDTNLQMQLAGSADFSGKYPAVSANIELDSVDFTALKLYSSEFRARGLITLDFPELNPDYPKGSFFWSQPIINANNKRYYLDSMYVVSRPSADTGQYIVADLDVMQAIITGKTPLSKIPAIVMDHINRHYTFPVYDSTNTTMSPTADTTVHSNKSLATSIIKTKSETASIPSDYDLKIYAHIIDKPMLHGLLPGLNSFDSIHVDGNLSPKDLTFNVKIPDLIYNNIDIQNGLIKVKGTDSAFTYSVTADQINDNKFSLWYANIYGNMGANEITTNISLSDNTKKERFAIGADIQKSGDIQVVHLHKGLKLNYNVWDVTEPNSITLSKDGIYIQDLQISNAGQSIKAQSDEHKANSPMKISITDFQLGNITDAISSKDTLVAGGVVNGTVDVERMNPSMQMTANLQIHNLNVLGDTLGDMKLAIDNKEDNSLNTNISLQGEGNDIALNGTYYLKNNAGNDFDMDLKVNAMALHSFEHIAMNQIKKTSGFIRGDLKINGTVSSPQITGELKTDNLQTTISALNSQLRMPAEKIEFANQNITFDKFTMTDSAGNKATLDGNVNIADLSNMQLGLNVKADNWRASHSTEKDNNEFYGDLLLSTSMDVKGSVSAPSIEGDLHILKGTKFTFVTPDADPQMESTEGIVKFVNMKDTGRLNVLVPKLRDTIKKHHLEVGSQFNVNVTVDKEAAFTLIIDRASGDFLSVKGDAYLNAAQSPGGDLSLSGNYELHEGAYQMNYNFIKRKFLIKDGSTITFGGDPEKGTTVDLTAVYQANIPPYDLVANEISDPTQLNYYKQNLPFNINLNLKGPVLQPAITFDVILPENQVYPISADQVELIQGKLSQVRSDTTELNKQVFAVLILGRFVSDDPFTNGAGGGGVGFTALQSVSTFIGEQLNQEAAKLVKGVDISADLATTEDYTTGDMRQRTDLNLAASKRLLNDRLKLTVGNDFELQGPQTSNDNQSQLVPSNLAADYLLAPDGRYTVRAYRKNYDEGVLEGYITETGLDFIVSVNYNHFKNVFKKQKKEQSNKKNKK